MKSDVRRTIEGMEARLCGGAESADGSAATRSLVMGAQHGRGSVSKLGAGKLATACVVLLAGFTVTMVGCAQGGPRRGQSIDPATADDRDGDGPVAVADAGVDAAPTTDGDASDESDAEPRRDGGTVITKPDASDASFPEGETPECTTADDCDNGSLCDGIERCNAGVCEPGTPRPCDDGIACTVDTCVEQTGDCQFVPDDNLCGATQMCSPALDCVDSAMCAGSPCDLVPQCGCAGATACYPNGSGGTICATEGNADVGDTCSSANQCKGGAGCTQIGEAAAVCMGFCRDDVDCSVGTACLPSADGYNFCTLSCRLDTQVGCPGGTRCVPGFREDDTAYSVCAVATGTGKEGDSCEETTDCAAGYACLFAQGATVGSCYQLCTAGGQCLWGSCQQAGNLVDIGGVAYGYCD